MKRTGQHFRLLNLGDLIKRSGKYRAFTVAIRSNRKTLELGAGCLIIGTFLYLSGVILLIGRCFMGEVTTVYTASSQLDHTEFCLVH